MVEEVCITWTDPVGIVDWGVAVWSSDDEIRQLFRLSLTQVSNNNTFIVNPFATVNTDDNIKYAVASEFLENPEKMFSIVAYCRYWIIYYCYSNDCMNIVQKKVCLQRVKEYYLRILIFYLTVVL